MTPECAAAVRAVLEALGKKAGPEDDRTEGKRFHDALQLACAPQPRVSSSTWRDAYRRVESLIRRKAGRRAGLHPERRSRRRC
jgi:hypothetical protein